MKLRCCARRTGLSSSTAVGKKNRRPRKGVWNLSGGRGGIDSVASQPHPSGAASGRLSADCVGLGSNPSGFVHTPPSGRIKKGPARGPFLILAVEGVWRGGCSPAPCPNIPYRRSALTGRGAASPLRRALSRQLQPILRYLEIHSNEISCYLPTAQMCRSLLSGLAHADVRQIVGQLGVILFGRPADNACRQG